MQFPKHKCGLYLTHNEHRDYYMKLETFIEDQELDSEDLTPEDRAECLRTDELWVLQWYPDTPIGSYKVAGPTLERVLERANAA